MIDETEEALRYEINETRLRIENATFQARLATKTLELEQGRLLRLERIMAAREDIS